MSGSAKGRVILNRLARASTQHVVEREGVCAWCGYAIRAAKDGDPPCPRCKSFEIDWVPTGPVIPAATRTRDEQWTPGSIAYSVMGGRVYGRK